MRLFFFAFLALTSSVATALEPSQTEASSHAEASSAHPQQQGWQQLYRSQNSSLLTTPTTSTSWVLYLRLQKKGSEWDQRTDDMMQLFTEDKAPGFQVGVPEKVSTYTLGRSYKDSTLSRVKHYILVNADVSLLEQSIIPLSGYWGKCKSIPRVKNVPIDPIATEFEKIIEIKYEERAWQVRALQEEDVTRMELQAAKMIYDVDKKQYEAYKAKMEQVTWQKLYRNPDGRLKTTSGNEWDVYLRLQTDSAWNSMTDDAIKLSSPEGSTGPERVTAFRLGRTYDDATSTLHFEGQYKEDPRNKDISLDGPEQPNLSLAGFWGRNETKDSWRTSSTTPGPVAVPITLIEIRWHQVSGDESSGWQVRFLGKKELAKMALKTAKTIYTLSKAEHEEYMRQTQQLGPGSQEWERLYMSLDQRFKPTPGSKCNFYLRLQNDPSYNSLTDDVIKLSSIQGNTAGPERATIYRLDRDDALRFTGQSKADPVNKDVPLSGSDRPNLPLAGFWGRSKTGKRWRTSTTASVPLAAPTEIIQIQWHQGPPGGWSWWEVRFLEQAEAQKMGLHAAKTMYVLTWEQLYRNPDERLKMTSGGENDVYLRLQKAPSPWNLMTDDVMKLLSPEGSTGPTSATTYRLGRSYDSVLRFNTQCKEVPWLKDVSLLSPKLPLNGFWGRSRPDLWPTTIGAPVPIAKPTEIIQIQWRQGPPGGSSGWQVRFLEQAEVEARKLQTAMSIYTLSEDEQNLYKFRAEYKVGDKRKPTSDLLDIPIRKKPKPR